MKYIQKLAVMAMLLLTSSSGAYEIRHRQILDEQKQVIHLHGVNWFGFETSSHIVHGLTKRNWRSMIEQMKTLGFNAVRIPLCPGTLQKQPVSEVDYALNPDLRGLDSLAVLDRVLQELDKAGMYLLLDHHRIDCHNISELWHTAEYREDDWIKDLLMLAERYRKLSHFLGIDIKNEPHGAAPWGTGNPEGDWNKAAERAAEAILKTNNKLLIFVQGVQENPHCSSGSGHWRGGNLEPFACTPLQIPAYKLVLSPHVYGPDVFPQSYFSAPDFPKNMPAIWQQHFGFLIDKNYPVVIGEFGGRYGHGGAASDKIWQDSLVDYLVGKKVDNAFYWSWNPNSGDTGGILQDDWQSVWDDKLVLLRRLWSGKAGGEPTVSIATVTPQSSPTKTVTPAVAAAIDSGQLRVTSDWQQGYCAEVVVRNDGNLPSPWQVKVPIEGNLTRHWSATVNASGDQLTAQGLYWNKLIPAHGQAQFGFCTERKARTPTLEGTAQVVINNDWGKGYCAEVVVRNPTTKPQVWQVDVPIQGSITNLWNASWRQNGSRLTASGENWNSQLPPQGQVNFGFCAERT